ncbi:MAG: hypothetical protein IPM64_17715 [Phycisphaerales bacterium]|nr:hypothetical protein [Phycisphaerales bacterium]
MILDPLVAALVVIALLCELRLHALRRRIAALEERIKERNEAIGRVLTDATVRHLRAIDGSPAPVRSGRTH